MPIHLHLATISRRSNQLQPASRPARPTRPGSMIDGVTAAERPAPAPVVFVVHRRARGASRTEWSAAIWSTHLVITFHFQCTIYCPVPCTPGPYNTVLAAAAGGGGGVDGGKNRQRRWPANGTSYSHTVRLLSGKSRRFVRLGQSGPFSTPVTNLHKFTVQNTKFKNTAFLSPKIRHIASL